MTFRKIFLCITMSVLLGMHRMPAASYEAVEERTNGPAIFQGLVPGLGLVVERSRIENERQKQELNALFDQVYKQSCKVKKSNFAEVTERISRKYGVDWRLVTAVMAAESNFNPCALSPRGAIGLMQLMPATAEMYKVQLNELYDPVHNIRAGVQHLRMLSHRFNGDVELVLAAYNAGEGTVDRFHGVPPYRETQSYVKRVLQYRNGLEGGVFPAVLEAAVSR